MHAHVYILLFLTQICMYADEYPQDTNAQVLSLAFGVGPSASLLFVGLDDDSVTVIDTDGICLLRLPLPMS